MQIMHDPVEENRALKYTQLLQNIPPVNRLLGLYFSGVTDYWLVKKILFYLMQVASNASTNRMSTDALSIVFGQMAGVFAHSGYELVKWLIEKYPQVYEVCFPNNSVSHCIFRKMIWMIHTLLYFSESSWDIPALYSPYSSIKTNSF